jgi:type IV pilus assembly protein PilV
MRAVGPCNVQTSESPCYYPRTLSAYQTPHIQRVRALPLRGFTLVEVLVALLIVLIGIIGVAALYTESQQATREAEPRVRAKELAEYMAARVRANAAGRTGYASVVGVVCDSKAKPKRPEDAAAIEAACWNQRVAEELPSGMGSVTRDTTTTPPSYIVAVSWSPPEGGAASFVIRVPGD